MRASNAYSKLTLQETPTLFLEFHGTRGLASPSRPSVSARSRPNAAAAVRCGPRKPEERTKLWQARHDSYWSMLQLRPGAKGLATDVCVPISRLAECVVETRKDVDDFGLIAPIVGHVGDGNFHVGVMIDMDRPGRGRRRQDVPRAARRARYRDGRHLHGRARRRPGQDEVSRGRARRPALDAMRAIKQALDPDNLMNPGKVLP